MINILQPARMLFLITMLIVAWATANSRLCCAHQKWLWPNRFSAEKIPAWISFDVSWSDRPFEAEEGVNDRPLVIVDPNGRSSPPVRAFVGKTKSTAEFELQQDGTYRLESIDPLTYWTQVEKDGKPHWIKKSKNEVTGAKIVRADQYWSKAIAYVSAGKPSAPPSLDADPLAIIPTIHPNEIRAGQPVKFNVHSYGKPVAAAELKIFDASSSGHAPTATIKCSNEGIGDFTFGAAGRYLIACQLEREAENDPKTDIYSFNVYLTLQIEERSN